MNKPATREVRDQLVTVKEAAEIAASYGLHDLNPKFWNNLIDRRKIPAVLIGARRRMLRVHAEGLIIVGIQRLRSQPPRFLRPFG